MHVEHLPLLRIQRQLLDEPRGFGRFHTYLRSIVGGDGELVLPLPAFNPMSKQHVADLLDTLLAMDAEAIAAETMLASAARLRDVQTLSKAPAYRFGLVVADDAHGGWTNRYLFEAKDRFENKYSLSHGFITALLWSSQIPGHAQIRRETATAIFRTAWGWLHGLPRTLGEMLQQEGMAARFAASTHGAPAAALLTPAAGLPALVRKHWSTRDYPAIMACLYGDAAAATLGYPPVGMTGPGALQWAASPHLLGEDGPIEAMARGAFK